MARGLRAALLFLLLSVGVADANVVVRGSEVSVTFGKAVAEQYMKDFVGKKVDVAGGGKDNAIMMLAAGDCDIANSALSLAEQDREDVLAAIESARADGHPIREVAIAVDAVDFIAHASLPVNTLTIEELREIYLGQITNWQQVGGPDLTINVYHSGTNDHKYFSIKAWLLGSNDFAPHAIEVDKKEMFAKIAEDRAGIGYDGVFYVSDALALSGDIVHSIVVNGSDSGAHAPSRRYPVSRNLYMFYREGAFTAEANDFLDYLLAPTAQRIIGGYVSPLMPAARNLELALLPAGGSEQKASISEGGSGAVEIEFQATAAASYVLYARNNSYINGTFPVLQAADGTARSVTNGGLFIVNRSGDPKSFNGLKACNITELRIGQIEPGDVMTFDYGGRNVTVRFRGGGGSSGGSSGCAAGFGALALITPLALVRRRRTR